MRCPIREDELDLQRTRNRLMRLHCITLKSAGLQTAKIFGALLFTLKRLAGICTEFTFFSKQYFWATP